MTSIIDKVKEFLDGKMWQRHNNDQATLKELESHFVGCRNPQEIRDALNYVQIERNEYFAIPYESLNVILEHLIELTDRKNPDDLRLYASHLAFFSGPDEDPRVKTLIQQAETIERGSASDN